MHIDLFLLCGRMLMSAKMMTSPLFFLKTCVAGGGHLEAPRAIEENTKKSLSIIGTRIPKKEL